VSPLIDRAAQTPPFWARCARWQWHDSVRIDIVDVHGRAFHTLAS
jgi:hypothetical protein